MIGGRVAAVPAAMGVRPSQHSVVCESRVKAAVGRSSDLTDRRERTRAHPCPFLTQGCVSLAWFNQATGSRVLPLGVATKPRPVRLRLTALAKPNATVPQIGALTIASAL